MIANALFSRQSKAKGFTLLELLIVITILAILAVIIIFVLNPAETLRKSRDVQRLSDLATLKNAISLYTTTTTTPQLDGNSGTVNDKCNNGTAANEELWVSATEAITDTTPPSGWVQAAARWEQPASVSAASAVDGTGWIPVALSSISGGSPISNMPLDPTNDVSIATGSDTSTAADVNNGALMYRYACDKTNVVYEINARMESTAFGTSSTDDNKASKDGGNNPLLYEVGTLLTILPGTNDF